MKIREVRIRNFRNFGANARAVSFVDPLTQQVRPLSVLVGSNGCGKTTVLDVIEGLLSFAVGDFARLNARDPREALRRQGYADILMEFPEVVPNPLRIALGHKVPSADREDRSIEQIAALYQQDANALVTHTDQQETLQRWVRQMVEGGAPLAGGLIHFPHRRWVEHEQKGAIKEPPSGKEWLFRFEGRDEWDGSLSQLWVWQNYLDLEQKREGRPNLTPFVAEVEAILGRGRKVVIRNGRVRIEESGRGVELHQLPSGEQQVLTLFGEIIRQLRPGGVLMIDEVEISLHPALQRVVLHRLRELARRHDLQIILTTHSMDIVAAVAPEELVNLDEMVLEERAQAGGAE
ncbi:ATP-binding protein [Nannocystis sp.]|uniref:AAA family ATPase n=1 Tax=Nannocystis sp. TaxID=1962667 RepID=UPI0024227071|nr:ATP-binding protein [Nannocystis sp.]MBK7825657.1 AAA family ATPase [Nannocystis sp.]MBK9757139.1 AAA family ATPase [Nannocystis sp.]